MQVLIPSRGDRPGISLTSPANDAAAAGLPHEKHNVRPRNAERNSRAADVDNGCCGKVDQRRDRLRPADAFMIPFSLLEWIRVLLGVFGAFDRQSSIVLRALGNSFVAVDSNVIVRRF